MIQVLVSNLDILKMMFQILNEYQVMIPVLVTPQMMTPVNKQIKIIS